MSIQDVKFNREHPNSYMELATRAAECEQNGLWSHAEALWNDAAKVASRPQNKDWAEKRASLCEKGKFNKWRVAA